MKIECVTDWKIVLSVESERGNLVSKMVSTGVSFVLVAYVFFHRIFVKKHILFICACKETRTELGESVFTKQMFFTTMTI